MKKYSIDTSGLLDGWRRYYPPDVMPGLWKNLEILIAQGTLIASEMVRDDLKKKDDEVYAWAQRHGKIFHVVDEQTQKAVSRILSRHRNMIHANRNRSGSDPFVIALAMVQKGSVVTGERPSGSLKKPKMPDVCNALGVPCANLVELCRQQKWVFHPSQ
ncbi:DUF4411 family protein [Elusimicrobiota bacterium]